MADLSKIGARRLEALRRSRFGSVEISSYGRLGALAATPELARIFLKKAGTMLVSRIQRSFREQSRGGKDWPARAVPNIAGVLADVKAGRNPPARRWDPRPALTDTGRLRGSIAAEVKGSGEGMHLLVGTNVPYARKHQEGFSDVVPITPAMRVGLARWVKKQNAERRKALGWLLRADQVKVGAPARPFVVLTNEDRKDLKELARRTFKGGGQP